MSGFANRHYGAHPSQYVEVYEPAGESRDVAILLVHGGWWRQRLDLRLMSRLAVNLRRRGYLVWNAEYRRIDAPDAEGGWPASLHDLLAAIEMLCEESGIRPARVLMLGHSAGGHLGLLASREAGLAGTIALAPITDLVRCAVTGLGEGATPIFMGCPLEANVQAYRQASPVDRVPIGSRQLIVHGGDDDRVPIAHSRSYVERARAAGDSVDFWEIEGGDHMFVLDPEHAYWDPVTMWIERTLEHAETA